MYPYPARANDMHRFLARFGCALGRALVPQLMMGRKQSQYHGKAQTVCHADGRIYSTAISFVHGRATLFASSQSWTESVKY
jgi:hypothetical protein